MAEPVPDTVLAEAIEAAIYDTNPVAHDDETAAAEAAAVMAVLDERGRERDAALAELARVTAERDTARADLHRREALASGDPAAVRALRAERDELHAQRAAAVRRKIAAQQRAARHADDADGWETEARQLRRQRAAALALADQAEHGARRWADPLPVPEWVGRLREALGVEA